MFVLGDGGKPRRAELPTAFCLWRSICRGLLKGKGRERTRFSLWLAAIPFFLILTARMGVFSHNPPLQLWDRWRWQRRR